MKQGTVITGCKCQHEFQDKKYGANQRVHNTTQKGDKDSVDMRCTVCQSVKRVQDSRVK